MHRFTSLFMAGVFAAALPAAAAEQQPQPAAPQHDEHQTASAQPGVSPEQEKQMMAMHQKTMAEMRAMDAKVDALVARMKRGKGRREDRGNRRGRSGAGGTAHRLARPHDADAVADDGPHDAAHGRRRLVSGDEGDDGVVPDDEDDAGAGGRPVGNPKNRTCAARGGRVTAASAGLQGQRSVGFWFSS